MILQSFREARRDRLTKWHKVHFPITYVDYVSSTEKATRNHLQNLNCVRYYDLQVGNGANPSSGYLVVFDVKGQVHGTEQVFVDTFGSKKSLAMVMDSRPYSKGLCQGVEFVLRSMKAGGKRRVIIPPSLGFGDKNVEFGQGLQIPPSATLDYTIEVDTVYCFQTIV